MKKLTTDTTNNSIGSMIAKLFGAPFAKSATATGSSMLKDCIMSKTCTEEVKVTIEPNIVMQDVRAVEKRFPKINTTLSKLDYWE